jgi:ferredoxin
MKLDQHPTVVHHRKNRAPGTSAPSLSDSALLDLARELGADDVALVPLDRPALSEEREQVLRHYPWCRSALSFVVRMNREPIRSTLRSVSNLEFHHVGEQVNEVSRAIVTRLEKLGMRAQNPSMGFPMEMDRFPGRIWIVSHKLFAVEGGLGKMGVHRNVIHPHFGNFVLLGTVLLEHEVSTGPSPLDFNPCLECKLCVAACPVGAVHPDGGFDFSACMTHNYREFMGGFSDFIEQGVESNSLSEYRDRVRDNDSASMWQSLSFGANYKAAYCLAVCPAGEEVIGPFLDNRQAFMREVLEPLREKEETLYVVAGSDAEAHARKRFPHKELREANHGLRPRSVRSFLDFLPVMFQRGQAPKSTTRYHMRFRGAEEIQCTVELGPEGVHVSPGLHDRADLALTADSSSWLRFLAGERGVVRLLLTGKLRLKGNPRHLLQFARCFPLPRSKRPGSRFSS